MPLRDYLEGVAFVVVVWGAVGWAAALALRRLVPDLRGLARAIALGVAFLALLVAVHLLPGALGLLGRPAVLVAAGLALLGATRLPQRRADPPADREAPPGDPSPAVGPPPGPQARVWWALAAVATATYAGALAYFIWRAAPHPITHIDALTFHLPGVARWLQSGSIWNNEEFVPQFPTGTYPNTGNVVFLAAVLPWHNDAFVRLLNVPCLLLTAAAVYGIGRELRAPRPASALFATVVVSTRAISSYAVDQVDPDVVTLTGYATGAFFLVRHLRSGRRADLVLAGLGLGIAFGTKWYGPSTVVALGLAWVLALWVSRRPWRAILRQGAGLSAIIAALGGVWLIRNWVSTGDPMYPLRVKLLGLTIFNAPVDRYLQLYGHTLLDRIGQPRSWSDFILPDLREALGLPGILLGVLLIGWLAVLTRNLLGGDRSRELASRLMLALGALLVTVAYVNTPASAQGPAAQPWPGLVGGNSRYLMPAFLLAGPLGAAAIGRLWAPWALGLGVLGGLAVLDGVNSTFSVTYLGSTFSLTAILATVGAMTLGVGAAGALVWLVRRLVSPTHAGPAAVGAVGVALALAAVVAGQSVQSQFNSGRYTHYDVTLDWVVAHAPANHRIGVAGDWTSGPGISSPIWPLFGPRLGNQVSYVGPMLTGTLGEYHTRREFVTTVARNRYDLLLVGLITPLSTPLVGSATPLAWAQAAGFSLLARSNRFALYAAPSGGVSRELAGAG